MMSRSRRLIPRIGATRFVTVSPRSGSIPFRLSILVQIPPHGLRIVVEAQIGKSPAYIISIHGLSLLLVALVGRLSRNEADEFRHALLHRFFGVLRDLRIRGQDLLHDPPHIRDREEAVLLLDGAPFARPPRGGGRGALVATVKALRVVGATTLRHSHDDAQFGST